MSKSTTYVVAVDGLLLPLHPVPVNPGNPFAFGNEPEPAPRGTRVEIDDLFLSVTAGRDGTSPYSDLSEDAQLQRWREIRFIPEDDERTEAIDRAVSQERTDAARQREQDLRLLARKHGGRAVSVM
jgi:hypothetical protein